MNHHSAPHVGLTEFCSLPYVIIEVAHVIANSTPLSGEPVDARCLSPGLGLLTFDLFYGRRCTEANKDS